MQHPWKNKLSAVANLNWSFVISYFKIYTDAGNFPLSYKESRKILKIIHESIANENFIRLHTIIKAIRLRYKKSG
ncbi:MAG: DUF956 family protein [Eggerthellaceae bacterium]|nr:DUF956 family protein [Eggerthellaceae bacterium]